MKYVYELVLKEEESGDKVFHGEYLSRESLEESLHKVENAKKQYEEEQQAYEDYWNTEEASATGN